MTRFLDVLIAGLVMGGIYALTSLGLNLQYGVVRVLNMAHGEAVMLGGLLTFWLFSSFGIDPLIALLIGSPLMFVAGLLIYRLIYHPLRLKAPSIGEFEGYAILASYGLIFIIQNLVVLASGGQLQAYTYLAYPVELFGAIFAANRLLALFLTTFLSVLFYVWLSRSRAGKAIRAIAQDTEVAQLMGIRVDTLWGLTFALGAVLAGMAGVILSTMFPVSPTMGFGYTVIAVVVIVLGGLGNILGGLIAAFILGIVGAIVTYVQPGLVTVVFYLLFLIIILVRPTGILSTQRG